MPTHHVHVEEWNLLKKFSYYCTHLSIIIFKDCNGWKYAFFCCCWQLVAMIITRHPMVLGIHWELHCPPSVNKNTQYEILVIGQMNPPMCPNFGSMCHSNFSLGFKSLFPSIRICLHILGPIISISYIDNKLVSCFKQICKDICTPPYSTWFSPPTSMARWANLISIGLRVMVSIALPIANKYNCTNYRHWSSNKIMSNLQSKV